MAAAATPSTTEASRPRGGNAFALDRALLYDLADIALTAARRNGASYADVRIGETRREYAFAKDDRLENFDERASQGFGLRVLLDGCWGFYGARRLDPQSLRDGVERALENARAVKRIQFQPIALERLPAHEAEWIMPMGIDPIEVSAGEKADLLLSIIASARDHGADFCSASLSATCEERFFANSLGSRIHQTRTRVAPNFQATAIDRASGRFATRDCLAPARGAGWDYVVGAGLIEEAAQAGEEARAKLDAKTGDAGRLRRCDRPDESVAHDSRDGRPFDRTRPRARLGGEFRRNELRQTPYAQ